MIDKKLLEGLKSTIYLGKLQLRGETITEDDQKIRASGLYDDWVPGAHTVGEAFNTHQTEELGPEWEQTWECFQSYDNAVYPDIKPGSTAWYTFNRPLHGKTRETARPFVPVQGSHDLYRFGEWMIFTDGELYKCIAPNGTNFSPTDYPAGWSKDVEVTG